MRWKCAFLCVVFSLAGTLAQAGDVYYPDLGHSGPGWDGVRPSPAPPKKKEKETDLSLLTPDLFGVEECAEDTDTEGLEIWHRKPRSYSHSFEWLGFQAGLGIFSFYLIDAYTDKTGPRLYQQGASGPILVKTDLQLFNLQMGRFYLTCLELHPGYAIGFAGGGVRMGYRLPLRYDFSNELRIGSYLGGELLPFIGALIMPHIQFIHNRPLYSVGVGVDIPIMIVSSDAYYYRDELFNLAGGFMLYVRIAIGRTFFSIPERNPGVRGSYDLLQER